MTMAETGPGTSVSRSPGGIGFLRDMAVNPFHRIRRREGQTPRQHFVERDPKRVEIAPGIDRTVHSSGLLRRHVGKCSGDELGRSGAWRSRGRREAMPKPVSHTSPVAVFTRILAGLMSLWMRPRWCTLPRAAATPTAMAQETSHLHRRAELAARATRRQDPRAPEWSGRDLARAPAAARPMRCPAHP